MDPLIQGLLIGFFGIALHVAIDTYEPNRAVAFVLKCLVVMWGVPRSFIVRVCLALDFFNLECGAGHMLDSQHRHSPGETWRRRRRRRHILSAIVIVVLFAAFLFGWLYVFGVV
jgi:hypothetical protein